MPTRDALLPLIAMMLYACGNSETVGLDPKNDVHCSTLTFYHYNQAVRKGAPRDQQRALQRVSEWYLARSNDELGERINDREYAYRKIGPVLATIKADPVASGEALNECARRATTNPAFYDSTR